MIRYALKCDEGHQFESWFQSSAAFEKLAGAGHLACVICGSGQVEKSLMVPKVRTSKALGDDGAEPVAPPVALANAPSPEAAKALEAMRKKVEAEADYVGDNFAADARAMHLGDTPERAIYGETNAEQAKALIEDGVPVLPLPFKPKRKLS
jgi:hypothetical protein